MSLLCKNNKILRKEEINLKGKISLKSAEISNENVINLSEQLLMRQENLEKKLKQAEEDYNKMLLETENEKKSILEEAQEKAKNIEKQAYEKGYDQGLKNGYEDGYKESYESNIEKALEESKEIVNEGYRTLFNINNQISSYLEDKRSEILSISIVIAEQVLRERFEDEKAMNNMIENIIKECNLKKTVVIKVNPIYKDSLQNQMDILRGNLSIVQDIFIVSDSNIEKGNAELQTQNGLLKVGIDSVLDRVKAELI